MNSMIKKYPNAVMFVLAIVLFAAALVTSVIVNRGIVKQYFPYIAPIMLFVVTWFLFRKEGKTLKTIGLNFNLRNLSFLPLGIFVGAFAFFGAKYLRTMFFSGSFELADTINYTAILCAFYFILPQVATEELLFRGYLFNKTIEVSNVMIANIIFSILFMLIHVLDENVLSNLGMIIFMCISIPVGHLLFATAMLKSKTLYFPIGLHLGNNWATRHLISDSNFGDSIFLISNNETFDTWVPFIMMILLFNGFYLLVTFLIWKWDVILSFKLLKK